MAKDLIQFSNDRKGFRRLIVIELVITALFAVNLVSALIRHIQNRVFYSAICLLAMAYITVRSIRGYRAAVQREKEEAVKRENGEKTE